MFFDAQDVDSHGEVSLVVRKNLKAFRWLDVESLELELIFVEMTCLSLIVGVF